jgi:hypothetical protein
MLLDIVEPSLQQETEQESLFGKTPHDMARLEYHIGDEHEKHHQDRNPRLYGECYSRPNNRNRARLETGQDCQ